MVSSKCQHAIGSMLCCRGEAAWCPHWFPHGVVAGVLVHMRSVCACLLNLDKVVLETYIVAPHGDLLI